MKQKREKINCKLSSKTSKVFFVSRHEIKALETEAKKNCVYRQ